MSRSARKVLITVLALLFALIIIPLTLFAVTAVKYFKCTFTPYDIGNESDWVELQEYSAEKSDYLGSADRVTYVSKVSDLPEDKFVYLTNGYFYVTRQSVMMKKGLTEPIFDETFLLKEITISYQDGVTVTDYATVLALRERLKSDKVVALSRSDDAPAYIHPENGDLLSEKYHVRFKFDMSGELSWHCFLDITDSGRVYFIFKTADEPQEVYAVDLPLMNNDY